MITPTPSRPGASCEAQDRETAAADRGTVAITLAICMVALIGLAGLVVDGSRALQAQGQAHDLAEQAARAAAGRLSDASLRRETPAALRINQTDASSAAQTVLDTANASGSVHVNGKQVTVTATVPAHAAILSIFGVSDLDGSASATAIVLHGTAEGSR